MTTYPHLAAVKNECSYTCSLSICLGAIHRNNFAFSYIPLTVLATNIWDTSILISHSMVLISVITYLLTYLLTPWSRVLLEKLASLQLVKKFPACYGTRGFLTALTSARHLSLSWASPIKSSYPNPTSWRSILILSSHLRLGLPSGLFPSGFPTSSCWIVIDTYYAILLPVVYVTSHVHDR